MEIKIENLTPIYLKDDDIAMFVEFQKHYDRFKILSDNGLFSMKNGKAIINFDQNGQIGSISMDFIRYKA